MALQFTENRQRRSSLSFSTNARARMASITSVTWTSVTGKPDVLLDNANIGAIDDLTGTGILSRTGIDTWALRSLTSPAAGVTITNPAGVAGDPTLVLANDLAALEAMSGTGIVSRTAAETYAQRTITAPAAGITVSNGDGVSGNPTLALANDLAAVEGLASTGIAVRTASDTWAQRTVTGTTAEITVTNGDGVSGNPTISLPSALTFTGKTVTGGTFNGFTLGSGATLTDPLVDDSITWTSSGSNRIVQSVGTSQNVMNITGEGNSKTAAIHLNPGSGTRATDTIAEYVLQATSGQAFGGDYGRWSFTTLGSSNNYISGLYGEYGGTTAVSEMGPFIFHMGVENPASTFTNYEYIRFQTTGSAVAATAGAVGFGVTTTVPFNQVVMNMSNIGSAGTRDSNAFLQEGKANDGTERAVWWRQFVDVTSNAGASTWTLQQNLNGGGWTSRLMIPDTAAITMPAATDTLVGKATTDTLTNKTFNTAGTGNVFQINGTGITAVTGSNAVVLATSPTIATPTITTSLTGPLVYGGTGTGSTLTLQSTSGVGATDAVIIKTGNGVEAVRADTGQRFLVGLDSSISVGTSSTVIGKVQVAGAGGAGAFNLLRYSATGFGGALFMFGASSGAAPGTFSGLVSGNGIGSLIFYGDNGTNYEGVGATIRAQATETWSGSTSAAKLDFLTTPSGAATATVNLTIESGNVVVGTGAAIATNATVGFFHIISCAGAATGAPAKTYTGSLPMVYDSTNNKIYVYNGAWKSTAALT